jgi:hypothetical protein
MKQVSQLTRWEHKVEKSPLTIQLRLYAAAFVISLMVGFLVAVPIRIVQSSAIEKAAEDIHSLENARMNERINQLKTIHYIPKNP